MILGCWLLWLNRYVIYTRDGAKLDFSLSPTLMPGQTAVAPPPGTPVDIIYQEEDLDIQDPQDNALQQLKGCYADASTLKADFDALSSHLTMLSADTPILLDVRNVRSEFFYSSGYGRSDGGMDPAAFASLVKTLKDTDHYLIARLPAFREYWYILDNEAERVAYGLPRVGANGALWLDDTGPNYWLNPASDGALSHLTKIVAELKAMGFDEVVFDEFRFPDTDLIVFDGDRAEAIRAAAEFLVTVCSGDDFAVSFFSEDPAFPLPEGRSRLYLKNADAEYLEQLVAQTGLDPESGRLVFITEQLDTRFDDYALLRPADIYQYAHRVCRKRGTPVFL